jgi:hypothetical protein
LGKEEIMKNIFVLLVVAFFATGCSQKIVKEPYHYPNYKIIKPKITCKPKRKNIEKLLLSYLGKPYVWAEEGPDAFDCSGLTYNIYGKMGISIPRTASEQAKMGKRIPFSQLHYGDLIFFGPSNRRSRRINHVGIYLGSGWFAHASSKDRRVTVSHFEKEPHYLKRIKLCRRYLSIDERSKYMSCSVPLKKMKTTDKRYTTPWKRGMRLPRKAVP